MPERELARTESKPEIENWLEDVYRALQWQAPLSADVQNGDVIHEKLSSAELQAEAETKQEPGTYDDPRDDPAYLAEKNALLARLKQLNQAKLAERKRGPFVKGSAYEDNYYDAFTLLKDLYDEARHIAEQRDSQGLMDLKATETAIGTAEKAASAAITAYLKAKDDAEHQLQSYYDTSENLQRILQTYEKARPALHAWGIDLTGYNEAYASTMDTLTTLNKALAGSDLKAGIQAKNQSDVDVRKLEEAHAQAIVAADTRKAELSQNLSSLEGSVNALHKKQQGLIKAQEHLAQFRLGYERATGSLAQAQKDLDRGLGTDAKRAIEEAGKQHLVMQQVWLQGRAHASAQGEQSTSNDPKIAFGKLSVELERQHRFITDQLEHTDLVKRCSSTPNLFETSKQLARDLMEEAQSGLIDGNKRVGQNNLQALKDIFIQMEDGLNEARANFDICVLEIEEVQKDLDFHYRGRDVLVRYERVKQPKNSKVVKRFDEDYEKALNILERSESLLNTEGVKAARDNLKQARKNVKSLKDTVNLFQIALKKSPISGPEDQQFKIGGAIRDLRGELDELYALRSVFKDKEERDHFDNWYAKTISCVEAAETALEADLYERAEDLAENAEITLQTLRDSYERGVDTASKIEGYLQEAEAGKQSATSLYERHLSITEDDKLGAFLKHHAIALDSAKQAEFLLRRGDTREGRALLNTLRNALTVMEQSLIPTPKAEKPKKHRKLKDVFKRKPKAEAPSRSKKRK